MNKHYTIFIAAFILCLGNLALANPDILTIMLDEELYSLEPSLIDYGENTLAGANIYEALIAFDKDGGIAPVLATQWSLADDGLTYTFTLREGVNFHTGHTLTCQDAEYSIRRQLITNSGDGYAFRVSKSVLGFDYWDDEESLATTTPFAAVTGAVYCGDQNRLVIKLLEPDADFLVKLMIFYIADATFLKENGDWSGAESDWQDWINRSMTSSILTTTSAGTNAYQLLSFEPTRSVFKAFAGYWGQKASIETILLQSVPDYNTRVLAVKNGDADILFLLRPNFAQQLEGAAGVTTTYTPYPKAEVLVFNNPVNEDSIGSGKLDGAGIPPDFFSDIHVRRGFVAAFNAQQVVDEVLFSKGTVVNVAVPSPLLSTEPVIPFDLNRAREELEQAWNGQVWEQGFTLDVWTRTVPDGSNVVADGSAQVLKANLESLNPKFRVNIVAYSGDDFFDLAQGEAKAAIYQDYWSTEPLTTTYYLDFMYHSERGAYGTFVDETLDGLLDQLRNEGNLETRPDLIQQITQLGQELAPFIVLPEENKVLVFRGEVKGYLEAYNPFFTGDVQWNLLSKK